MAFFPSLETVANSSTEIKQGGFSAMPFLSPVTASLPGMTASRSMARVAARPLQTKTRSCRAVGTDGASTTMDASPALLRPPSSSSTTSTSYSSSSFSSSSSSPPPPPQNKNTKEQGNPTAKEQSKTTKEQQQRQRQKQEQKQKGKPKPLTPPPQLSNFFAPSPQSQLERKRRRQVYGVPPPRILDRVLLWGDAVLLFCCCCSSERIPVGCSLTLASAAVLSWVGVSLAKGDYSRSSANVSGFDPVSRQRDLVSALGNGAFTWLLFVPTALAADAALFSRGLVSSAPFLAKPSAAVLHAAASASNAAGSIVGGGGPVSVSGVLASVAAAGGVAAGGGGLMGGGGSGVDGALSGPLSWGVGAGAAPVSEVLVAALLTMVSWRGAYVGIKFFL